MHLDRPSQLRSMTKVADKTSLFHNNASHDNSWHFFKATIDLVISEKKKTVHSQANKLVGMICFQAMLIFDKGEVQTMYTEEQELLWAVIVSSDWM